MLGLIRHRDIGGDLLDDRGSSERGALSRRCVPAGGVGWAAAAMCFLDIVPA